MSELKLVPVEPQPEYIESSGRWKWPLPPQAPFENCRRTACTASREWWEYCPSEVKPHPMARAVMLDDGREEVWYWVVPSAPPADTVDILPDQFFDSDGNPVTLDKLCRMEPEWAANRIRALSKKPPADLTPTEELLALPGQMIDEARAYFRSQNPLPGRVAHHWAERLQSILTRMQQPIPSGVWGLPEKMRNWPVHDYCCSQVCKQLADELEAALAQGAVDFDVDRWWRSELLHHATGTVTVEQARELCKAAVAASQGKEHEWGPCFNAARSGGGGGGEG